MIVNYVQNPKFCYTHDWEPNDLIMWDNRVLLHRVLPYDYTKFRRAMIRGTVEGTSVKGAVEIDWLNLWYEWMAKSGDQIMDVTGRLLTDFINCFGIILEFLGLEHDFKLGHCF